MHLQDLLDPRAFDLDAHVSTKDEALTRLLQLICKTGCIADADAFRKNVLEREAATTTGVGGGLAIPHGRCATVRRPALAVMRVPGGCPFDALDCQPVRLFFLIAVPDGAVHMQVLSSLAALLMNKTLVAALLQAPDTRTFCTLLIQADAAANAQPLQKARGVQVAAVTACPLGVAHTYMAAQALRDAAEKLGIAVKVETHGADGIRDPLTKAEIAGCSGVIAAADRAVDLSRFAGKPLLQVPVSEAIRAPEKLLTAAAGGNAPVCSAAPETTCTAAAPQNFWHRAYNSLMNGVSHMLPFVICSGIFTALAFLFDSLLAPGSASQSFGTNTIPGSFCRAVGNICLSLILPILSGYIATAIANRPGLLPGLVSGWLTAFGYCYKYGLLVSTQSFGTDVSGCGFFGAIVSGFLSGFIILALEKSTSRGISLLNSMRSILLYPIVGTLLVSLLMVFVLNPIFADINAWTSRQLGFLDTGKNQLLDCGIGALLAGLMSVDLGGPVNKAAYLFATASLVVSGTAVSSSIMATVMAGGMVPPLLIALCLTFFPHLFTEQEQKLRLSCYVMGCCFLTEGALPFAITDALRILPASIFGSACAGALSMLFHCKVPAPHGGIFVVPLMENGAAFLLAVLAGSICGMFLLAFLKKRRSPHIGSLSEK